MLKAVNNKIIDIDNIELFEKIFECKHIIMDKSDFLMCTIPSDIDIINRCIEEYYRFYNNIPYPLNYLEDGIKYAVIGTYIQTNIKDKQIKIVVDNGLNIVIEGNTVLTFNKDIWLIQKREFEDCSDIGLDKYHKNIGYEEYNWILYKLINGGQFTDIEFYEQFMPDFVAACKSDWGIMKKELDTILTFGKTPQSIDLKQNKIISLNDEREIILDIYTSGIKKTGDKEYFISLANSDDSIKMKPKYTTTYAVDIYEKIRKNMSTGVGTSRLRKSNLIGVNTIFNTIASMKISDDTKPIKDFYGLLVDRHLIYSIDNRIFICKAYRMSEPIEIAHDSKLVSVDKGNVYFIVNDIMDSGVDKDTLYSYGIANKEYRIIEINFN